MRYQKREYKLVNIDNGTSIILNSTGTNNEPRGWDESDYTIKRSVENFSITTTLSNNLEFTGAGARFLIDAYTSKGVEANVKMFETRFNPNTDEPYVFTIADFDFSEIIRTKTTVKIPFTSGGLNQLLKAKLKDKFEFTRIESITGEAIQPVQTNEFAAINRPLFLDSLLKTKEEDKNSNLFQLNPFADTEGSVGVPCEIIYESDEKITSIIPNQLNKTPSTGLNAVMFYYLNDIDKSFKLDISSSFFVGAGVNISTANFNLDLVIYNGGVSLTEKERINLYTESFGTSGLSKNISESYYNDNFTLLEGESLSLEFRFNKDISALLGFTFREINTSISVQELSIRNDLPRRSKCILNKYVGRSLMNIINNDATTYKSDFFNKGDFKLTAVTSGKWIRGFLDDSITFSGKDWLENCNSLFNMGYNIEIIDGKETLVHEELKYFFRPETKITIPQQVNNVKRSVAKDFIYSTIKSGYKKPGGDNLYEEVNGLNEYNTSNEYITPITRVVSQYDIESPFRADSEGKELTVRKSIRLFPTEDYRTDKTIFNLDLKNEGTNVLSERVWQDDYEVEPQGIFSPDTATGLRLTPYRNMERHFWFINNSLTKYPDKYIRYSSTRGNSELITKKAGEEEKKENGDFKINSLENAIFVNEWIEFEYPVDFDLISQINGVSDVEGIRVPNLYFKVEFINEFNEKEYGYLFELQPNKEGKWKLLKAV